MRTIKRIFPVLLFLLLFISSSNVLAAGESVSYQGHVQNFGWMEYVQDGKTAGTTGLALRLEAVKMKLEGFPEGSHIEYSPHVEDYGWMNYVVDDQIGGTTGEGKRVEAFKINLLGPASETHDVYYRTHIADFGWLGWAKNNEVSGTSGYAKPMEGIQIMVVPKGQPAPGYTGTPALEKELIDAGDLALRNGAGLSYTTYVRGTGWQEEVPGGMSGTIGQNLPIESFAVNLNNLDGGLKYSCHVSDIGWTEPVTEDMESGPAGSGKQIEAIEVSLTGNIANYYDVYYRTHVSDLGWMGWAKNGQPSGTSNGFKAVQALEIYVIPKTGPGLTSPAPAFREFVKATPGKKTVQNFLATALVPVGRVNYVWGGGWNEEDDAAGPAAVHIGMYPNWEPFFNAQDASYDYEKTEYQILNGLDCSGYVGWVVYNIMNTTDNQAGEVLGADKEAQWYAQKGYGNYVGNTTDFWPGDIVSLKGHVYIVVGKCADGSYVIAHSSPPGVMLTGLVPAKGADSQARQLARAYMQKYHPVYFNRYNGQMDRTNSEYFADAKVFRWDNNSDPDGIRAKSANEVLRILFNE